MIIDYIEFKIVSSPSGFYSTQIDNPLASVFNEFPILSNYKRPTHTYNGKWIKKARGTIAGEPCPRTKI